MQGAEIDFIAALAPQRHVPRQHVEVPQRETGRQARLGVEGDGGGEFEEAEVGVLVFGAHAHADEFDFGDDEAVAGVAVAHQAVQVGEAGEVERLLAVFLLAHAGAPELPGFDEADDAAAAEGVGFVVGVGGLVERTVFSVALGAHGDVVLVALAGFEGCIDFGYVEGGEDVLKFAFVGDLEYRLTAVRLWESHGRNGNVEKAGAFFAVRETRDSLDGFEAEVFPCLQISDVPPAVQTGRNPCRELAYH